MTDIPEQEPSEDQKEVAEKLNKIFEALGELKISGAVVLTKGPVAFGAYYLHESCLEVKDEGFYLKPKTSLEQVANTMDELHTLQATNASVNESINGMYDNLKDVFYKNQENIIGDKPRNPEGNKDLDIPENTKI